MKAIIVGGVALGMCTRNIAAVFAAFFGISVPDVIYSQGAY